MYSWGYDYPLTQYFFMKEDISPKGEDDEDEEENYVFSVGNYIVLTPHPRNLSKHRYATYEIIELMLEEMKNNPELKINQEHIDAMILDIPF